MSTQQVDWAERRRQAEAVMDAGFRRSMRILACGGVGALSALLVGVLATAFVHPAWVALVIAAQVAFVAESIRSKAVLDDAHRRGWVVFEEGPNTPPPPPTAANPASGAAAAPGAALGGAALSTRGGEVGE